LVMVCVFGNYMKGAAKVEESIQCEAESDLEKTECELEEG
jgi:hypothetical protein